MHCKEVNDATMNAEKATCSKAFTSIRFRRAVVTAFFHLTKDQGSLEASKVQKLNTMIPLIRLVEAYLGINQTSIYSTI